MALIKLQGEIEFKTENNRYVTNSICLPKRRTELNTNPEFGLVFGWGTKTNTTIHYPIDILKAHFLLSPYDKEKCYYYEPSDEFTSLICIVIIFEIKELGVCWQLPSDHLRDDL